MVSADIAIQGFFFSHLYENRVGDTNGVNREKKGVREEQ